MTREDDRNVRSKIESLSPSRAGRPVHFHSHQFRADGGRPGSTTLETYYFGPALGPAHAGSRRAGKPRIRLRDRRLPEDHRRNRRYAEGPRSRRSSPRHSATPVQQSETPQRAPSRCRRQAGTFRGPSGRRVPSVLVEVSCISNARGGRASRHARTTAMRSRSYLKMGVIDYLDQRATRSQPNGVNTTICRQAKDKLLYVGIDLGTSRSVVSGSNGNRKWVESYVGWPKDFVAKKMLGKRVLFGTDALEHRLSLELSRPLQKRRHPRRAPNRTKLPSDELIEHLIELAGPAARRRSASRWACLPKRSRSIRRRFATPFARPRQAGSSSSPSRSPWRTGSECSTTP